MHAMTIQLPADFRICGTATTRCRCGDELTIDLDGVLPDELEVIAEEESTCAVCKREDAREVAEETRRMIEA